MKIYFFEQNEAEGSSQLLDILGGKGANLAEMCNIGLPVPSGFTIPTNQCIKFYRNEKKLSENLKDEIRKYITKIENSLNNEKKFGNEKNPLLVSVRSGAAVSMPGMMDTILNLGLNEKTVKGLAEVTQNTRFAYDSYRRFIQMYSNVVLDIPMNEFERVLEQEKTKLNIIKDTDLTAKNLKDIIELYYKIVVQQTGSSFPENVYDQLFNAVAAVFQSWMSERAIYYRKSNNIYNLAGTAVNIQAMVFGNMGFDSGTGVAFTRNPSTGENKIYGEYLLNAQGEDVVAGTRTPVSIEQMQHDMPDIHKQFLNIAALLEKHYKDVQDIEFTIEKGNLWILQTRSAKRTAKAAIITAVNMVNEGIISKNNAILRINAKSLDQLLHKTIAKNDQITLITRGMPASPGAAIGVLAFSCEAVIGFCEKNINCLLIRHDTSPEDIEGMTIANGIITTTGGMTSHAAVVARGMGKACITSAKNLIVDASKKMAIYNDKIFKEGDLFTIDGSTGEVFLGKADLKDIELFDELDIFMSWVDEIRKTKVRVNAETESDLKNALRFGAEGIGLCRTEHMFFSKDRILAIRKMILSENSSEIEKILDELMIYQKQDFINIFSLMPKLPVNIRLLDPPLHEFLPKKIEEIKQFADSANMNFESVKNKIETLYETNPMLGNRGSRLGIVRPKIYEMQIKAIFKAAQALYNKGKNLPLIEIMLPFIMEEKELIFLTDMIKEIAQFYCDIKYSIGTMIEIPRAALISDVLAKHVDYFSFGTNDLTQMTLGISRDDSETFIPTYQEKAILRVDPFVSIDQIGVGKLIQFSIANGKNAKKDLKIGICGEHGGDPQSIEFFVNNNFDYISCSPYRILTAKLAAAQAFLK